MAGAKKQSSRGKRAAGKRPRSAKEQILRAIQYASACACLVFLAILIKNISDDMVSYEVQWENQQRLDALNALSASPTAMGSGTPLPAAEPTVEGLCAALPSPSAAQGNMLAAFFGTPPVSTAAPAQDASATVAPVPSPTPDMSSRFTRYQNAPPPMQAKFQTEDFYYANPAFVGFLQAGVRVVEPVVYSVDNTYYLDYNFNNERDEAGAAFMDMRCSLWPRSQQIVIHGHNMENKTVFGSLDDMQDIDNLKAHPTVQFDTIYEDGMYVIFAAFSASMNVEDRSYFEVARYDFDTEADFDAYLAEVRERSMFDIPVDVEYADELLTLVTCSYHQDNGRFLLFTRKLRPGETVEEMGALVEQAEQVKRY